jgi:hypothetical protein
LAVKPAYRIGFKGDMANRRLYLYDLFLKPYWGKLNVRNFREGTGNVDDGGIRIPLRSRKGAGR